MSQLASISVFFLCALFWGTATTLINDSFTSGPREWWVGKICLKNLQTTAAQELHELELQFRLLIFDFFFWGVISDWECSVTILASPELTKSRTKHWRPKLESSAPSFDRAIVTMICGSSNDSLVVTWLMFGAWCGELGMTVWFLGNLEISVWISTFLVESYWWDELWIDLDDEEWTSIFWRVQWKSSLIWVNLVFSIIPKLFDKFYANISDLTANAPKKLTFTQKKPLKLLSLEQFPDNFGGS